MNFKPMLASPVDFNHLDFGREVYGSPKLDGIRAVVYQGKLVSRSLKPIRNEFLQDLFGRPELEGLDGELVVGSLTDPLCYTKTNSAVMSKSGEPEVSFYLFDHFGEPSLPFIRSEGSRMDRLLRTRDKVPTLQNQLVPLEQARLWNRGEVDEYEGLLLTEGHEGVMLRYGDSPYKFGRSTAKEGYLLKLKQFTDGEARIIGAECLYSNQNEATTDALGHTERSTSKEGLVPQDTLGVMFVKDLVTGVEFGIGTGFTAAQRKEIWDDIDSLIGKVIKYKSFPVGAKDKPRFPVFIQFVGFRDEIDLVEA